MQVAESTALLDTAIAAARCVEAPLRAAFRSAMTYTYKRDAHDIVTRHDKDAESRIAAVIHGAVPGSVIVGEEGGERGSGAVRWYVDPIDGTVNFARGIAQWCVSIAAEVEGELVAGVILQPVEGQLFAADLAGARRNGVRLEARAEEAEQRAVLLTGFPNARHLRLVGGAGHTAQAELLDAFQAVRNLGSGALHLAHVAAGWSDATLGLATNSWDVAAGILILRQAGGHYEGLRHGRSVPDTVAAPDYFATGRGVHYQTLERVVAGLSASTVAPQLQETFAS